MVNFFLLLWSSLPFHPALLLYLHPILSWLNLTFRSQHVGSHLQGGSLLASSLSPSLSSKAGRGETELAGFPPSSKAGLGDWSKLDVGERQQAGLKPRCRWLLTGWLGEPSQKVRLSQDRMPVEPLPRQQTWLGGNGASWVITWQQSWVRWKWS
jgi:hypothetical protein